MQARGCEIRRQREESGYGLTAFAGRIGISPSWLSRVERDQANPSPDLLRRIALELDGEQQARVAISRIAHTHEGRDGDNPAD
ncbi:helix-turn-helix domain-containing protein [Streptomyces iconiensis]|uniref:Helix-turn-helix transcriptional regulator n=1 Tax=Streptomyces iconiensis TaxID=1384038 RepID=A0ABT6ZVH0_9ACTN|nr:helix-turn-helix transcriptional regulator [Streptomyces iconiensis]MDJ1132433.1 helix-turn-helix transcriptional regulator [Streptomyces iconiensis]